MRASLRLAFTALTASCLVSPVALVSTAGAQTLEEEQASASTTTTTTTTSTGTARTVDSGHQLGDDQAAMEEEHPPPAADDGITTLADVHNRDYFTVGFFGRGVVTPAGMIGAFVAYRGDSPVNGSLGGYFGWRRNGLTFNAEVGYVGLGGNGYYRGLNAADTEMEFVQSRLGVVFGSVGVQWAIDIAPWFAIDLGFGIGLGGMTGDLTRQEAYQDPTSPYGYSSCTGPNMPGSAYCEASIERPGGNGRLDDSRVHGGTYQASLGPGMPGTGHNPFYFGDGGVPPMFGWLDLPRITVRFTPIRFLQIRIDVAYQLYGVMWGGAIGAQF